MRAVVYIHGKGGSASESEFYRPLFPDADVIGHSYRGFTPWESGRDIHSFIEKLSRSYDGITLIANSIGAYFCMNAGLDFLVKRALFISPIVDMERLICRMMEWAGISEEELESRGVIEAGFGEVLSWEYLCYVRKHPLSWRVSTEILYGSRDGLTEYRTIREFAEKTGAGVTVMENGEHFFHTREQMDFLSRWIEECQKKRR